MDRNKVFINNIYVFYEKFCKNCKKKPVLEPLIKLQSCNKQLYLKKRNCQIFLNSTKSTALLKTTSVTLQNSLQNNWKIPCKTSVAEYIFSENAGQQPANLLKLTLAAGIYEERF